MIVRIKGEWGSIGRAPGWLPRWFRQMLSWRKVGAFDFQKEVDGDTEKEWNLNSDWSIKLTIEEEIAEVSLLFREVEAWSSKYSFKDLEWPFKAGIAGQYAKGQIIVDF